MNPEAMGIAVLTHGYVKRLGFGITRISTHTIAAIPINGNNNRDKPLSFPKPTNLPVLGQNCRYFLTKFFISIISDRRIRLLDKR